MGRKRGAAEEVLDLASLPAPDMAVVKRFVEEAKAKARASSAHRRQGKDGAPVRAEQNLKGRLWVKLTEAVSHCNLPNEALKDTFRAFALTFAASYVLFSGYSVYSMAGRSA
ncbi:hypothetical protein TRVL_02533 [Trypanosoma vivax]|nr:hypothetical protein TRVL_02533 [Trypanosoma vivax]